MAPTAMNSLPFQFTGFNEGWGVISLKVIQKCKILIFLLGAICGNLLPNLLSHKIMKKFRELCATVIYKDFHTILNNNNHKETFFNF